MNISIIKLYRLIHIENLNILLNHDRLYSPNNTPHDGQTYRTIHHEEVQASRRIIAIPCGCGGTAHDYVPFYFGTHSPMLLQLKTGQVKGYTEGQEPIIHLITFVKTIVDSPCSFVFSDGHGLANLTYWYDDLRNLNRIDWDVVKNKQWADTSEDPDRKRRKQAEFLVHSFLEWSLIKIIAVINDEMKRSVENILASYPNRYHPPVKISPKYYY